MKTKVSLVNCKSYDTGEVKEAVSRALDLIGGIGVIVKPGEKILLKPNLLSARTPDRAVTTHPEVVRAAARLVREAGAVPILGDSPGGAVKGVERVWKETGMRKLAEEEGIELVNLETSGVVEKTVNHPLIRRVHLSKIPFDVDGIINLPKLKTHGFLVYTGAIKNFYGCVPGLRKAEYHKAAPHPKEFGRLLGEIYRLVRPKVRATIIDGIVGMEGNGPSSGDPRRLEMIAASRDGLALDTMLTHLLGLMPRKVEPLRYLAEAGAGVGDFDRIELLGDGPSSFDLEKIKFPSNWYLNLVPSVLVKVLAKYIWMKPAVIPETCKNCLMCVNSCPVKAIRRQPGAKPEVMPEECISCLCCHELCPDNAIELRSSFLAKRLIRQ